MSKDVAQEGKGKGKQGRPSKYTEELANFICSEIAEGKSLRSIIRDNEHVPSMVTIFNWLGNHESFVNQYTRAKDQSAEALADDIQDIARRTLNGEFEANSARVALDAYKWTAAKLKPKTYGDKVDVTSGGEPVQFTNGVPLPPNPNE